MTIPSIPTPPLNSITSQYQSILILKDFNPSQLIKYPNLSKLEIHPSATESPSFFTKLCKGLKTLKSLKVLHLDCSGQELNDKSIKELSFVLRRFHGLTSVSLNFKHNYRINGESLVELFRIIKKKRSVKKLWIDFSGCGKVSYEHLAAIYHNIAEMKPLKSFFINYSEASIQCDGRPEFAKTLMRLRKLRFLEDLFVNFKMLQTDMTTISHNISHMKKLSKVSLDFTSCSELEPTGFKFLADSLRSCSKLQKLHLNPPQFSSSNFVAQNLFDLVSQAFEHSPTLSSLILNFSYNHRATSSELQRMLLTLHTLPNLSALDLNFSFCINIDNKTLQFLAKSIMNLKNLTSLKINFFQCSLLNGQGLFMLSEALKNLTSLQVFELHLTSSAIGSGLPSLFQALYRLKSLYKLSLRFYDCQDISDEDLKALAEVLSCLKYLRYLDLSLRFCISLSDIGVKNLAFHIKSLQSLKRLSLNCFGCRGITLEGVEYFKHHLAQLKSLREVCLEFPRNLCSVGFDHQPQQEFSCQSTCSIF